MFEKILVPVDFSERSDRAIDAVIELVGEGEASVRLFHVIEAISGIRIEDEEDFFARLETRARQVLDQHGRRLAVAGIDWDSEVVYGSRVRRIVAKAEEMSADLILLASHRLEPERPGGGWGTLSYQAAILAPCSVLLVK
jgi:nucleotide-binding universal stress UspA family protein